MYNTDDIMDQDNNRPHHNKNNKRKGRRHKKSKRTHHRIPCNVATTIRNLDSGADYEVKCINLSLKGVGIEMYSFSDIRLLPEDIVEVYLRLRGQPLPIHKFGKIVWLKPIYRFYYKAGIEFSSLRKQPSL